MKKLININTKLKPLKMMLSLLLFVSSISAYISFKQCESYQGYANIYANNTIIYLPVTSECKKCSFVQVRGKSMEFGLFNLADKCNSLYDVNNFTSFFSSDNFSQTVNIAFYTCLPGYCGMRLWQNEYLSLEIEMLPIVKAIDNSCTFSSNSCNNHVEIDVAYNNETSLLFMKQDCFTPQN